MTVSWLRPSPFSFLLTSLAWRLDQGMCRIEDGRRECEHLSEFLIVSRKPEPTYINQYMGFDLPSSFE
jgi:hypothetical protein